MSLPQHQNCKYFIDTLSKNSENFISMLNMQTSIKATSVWDESSRTRVIILVLHITEFLTHDTFKL